MIFFLSSGDPGNASGARTEGSVGHTSEPGERAALRKRRERRIVPLALHAKKREEGVEMIGAERCMKAA